MTTKSSRPTRRAFITAAGLAAGSTVAAAIAGGQTPGVTGGPYVARKRYTLKLVTSWPKNFPGTGTGVERLAKQIMAMTDNAITIKVYAGGELVPALAVFDAVAEGKADLYHAADYYWQGKHPAFNFFTTVPFGLTADEMNAWIYHGGGQALWDELTARFGVKSFACGNTGVQSGGWFKRPIRSLADFRGLRMRIPGLGGEVAKMLGATPVTKAGGEIFLALSQGNIDATEWIGPWNDMAFGFYEVAPYYYGPGFHEPGATLALGINKALWDGLPKAYQAIIENAAAAENVNMHADYTLGNARALQTLATKHKVVMRPFPDDVMDAAAKASGTVLATVAAHDDLARRTAESFFAARRVMSPWTQASEQAYTLARKRTGSAA
jgi:TRAP-type mannitol/chloroaromatic compound transport system substrate-binding protein